MNLRKNEREAIVEALRAAKKHLRTGKSSPADKWRESHICFALEDVVSVRSSYAHGARLATELVMARLYPYFTVSKWLGQGLRVPHEQLTTSNVQAYRHRWVDALIKEFSS